MHQYAYKHENQTRGTSLTDITRDLTTIPGRQRARMEIARAIAKIWLSSDGDYVEIEAPRWLGRRVPRIPGTGSEIEGAMQHAPHPARQSITQKDEPDPAPCNTTVAGKYAPLIPTFTEPSPVVARPSMEVIKYAY